MHCSSSNAQVVGTMYEVPAAWGKSELVTYQMLAEASLVESIRAAMQCAIIEDDCNVK
jgi:hypothetical protein